MISRIEQRASGSPLEVEKGMMDPRVRIHQALPILPEYNARFVEVMVGILEKSGREADLTTSHSLLELVNLATTPEALKRQKERQLAERVDMMEILEPFSPEERVIIAKNLGAIQMTDGCTVGCPWCGVEAKRGISRAFSFEAYKRFINEFGKYVPNRKGVPFGFYEASDPFDWVSEDGESDYGTLVHFLRDKTRSKQIFTSTAAPVGTEVSIASFLASYLIRNYDRVRQGKRLLEDFRFSVTKDNKDRVMKIMQFIKDLRLMPEKYLRNFIELRDRSEEIGWDNIEPNDKDADIKRGAVRNVGYYVHKPDRGDSDCAGIACQDSLILSPLYARNIRGRKVQYGGITTSSMECVTTQNSIGKRRVPVIPGRIMIPKHITNIEYEFPHQFDPKGKSFPILPKHRYNIYEDGKFAGSKNVESVRRDALAFYWAYLNLTDWDIAVKGEEGYDLNLPPDKSFNKSFSMQLEEFVSEFRKRKESCIALFDREADEEAVETAKRFIQKIEDWIADLERRIEAQKLVAVQSEDAPKA